jgi:hypothetical protein
MECSCLVKIASLTPGSLALFSSDDALFCQIQELLRGAKDVMSLAQVFARNLLIILYAEFMR